MSEVKMETARETYPKLHANTSGPEHQGETSREAQAALDEIDRLRFAIRDGLPEMGGEHQSRQPYVHVIDLDEPEYIEPDPAGEIERPQSNVLPFRRDGQREPGWR